MRETDYTRFVISNIKVTGKWDWTKPQKCMVCILEIKENDDVVYCPYCHHPAHREHLLEWLHVKGNCPHCQHPLREEDLLKSLEGMV